MPLDVVTSERIPEHVQVLLLMDKLLPDKSKWYQGGAHIGMPGSPDRKGCLFFGILADARKALGLKRDFNPLEYKVLEDLIPGRFRLGQAWNDDPDTTFKDIKALLAKAIEVEMSKVMA